MIRSVPVGEVRTLGDHALVIGVADAPAARALVGAIRASPRSGVQEVVGGLATVMVRCPALFELDEVAQWMRELAHGLGTGSAQPRGAGDAPRVVTLPCSFDGPDLNFVAGQVGASTGEVAQLLTAQPLTVAAVGFSPGFAYLEGLPPQLCEIPRRPMPRPVVLPGSVALANGHAAVYPTASPGGWQLIGRTSEWLFNPAAAPYARLFPGDLVQLARAAGSRGSSATAPVEDDPWVPPSWARPVFVVEEPGLYSVVQDLGRQGMAALGVPQAGPADPHSFEVANRVVGNAPHAGTLEISASGPALRALQAVFIAVVGASPQVHLQGQPVAAGQVVPVQPNQQLRVGAVRQGFRSYLAVAGGFVGPAVLGSMASDQLAALGPGPIRRGTSLWAGPLRPPLGDHVESEVLRGLQVDGVITLRVVPGPHTEWFTHGALERLSQCRFTVGGDSNRVGLRLHNESDAQRARLLREGAELDSQAMVTGAVQIPPSGDPVILLPDHATLGGYPVVAVVATVDHGLLGQCAPGSVVQLSPINLADAREALRVRQRSLQGSVQGHYPLVAG
jgi:KipI family sensor histidine kinase inhibitor